MTQAPNNEPPFDGNIGLGLVALVLLGPLLLVGAACAVVGFLAIWGVEIGPWCDANVPVLVDLLYGGGSGAFRGFLFFMGGAVVSTLSWTGIVWCFTGRVPG